MKKAVSVIILSLLFVSVPYVMSNTMLSTAIHRTTKALSNWPTIEGTQEEEIFVMAYPSDIGEMNPLFSRSERTGWYLIQLYDSLIAYNTEMDPIPWLAESWEISEDAKNFTFYLREDVKWHDGAPLNASDIKFTLEYYKAASEDALGWFVLRKMVKCTVHDEYTVSVVFNETMGFGLTQVGEINIVPKHIRDWGDWENGNSQHAECWDDPDNVTAHTGSGPFKFVERVEDEYILLEKNPDWWGKEPNVDGIRIDVIYGQSARILAMRQGIADTERYELWGANIQTVMDAPELKVITGVASQWDYVLGFNLTILGLDDTVVREAICCALDRAEIIEVARAGYGTATWSVIPEAFFPAYYSEEGTFPEQNITYANQILDAAGYLDTDGDGIRNFPYPDNDTEMIFDMQVLSWDTISVDAGIAIAAELEAIDIDVTVEITDDAVMYPNLYALPRNYRIYEMSHGFGGYPDHVWDRMHSCNDIDWGDNCYGLHNATMDAALDDLLHAINDTARVEAAAEVQALSVELTPYIPLFLSDDTHAIRKEWINYTFVPGGIFTSMNRLTMLNIYSEPKTWTVDDDGPADFHTIQEAINAANSGDMVFVYNGTYYENVVVNKTVSLVGENRDTTIIDSSKAGNVVTITQDNVNITGFTIQNSGGWPQAGMYLNNVNHCNITKNDIAGNEYGIRLWDSSNNTLSGNKITANNLDGIWLYVSSNNTISGNNITNNWAGIDLVSSSNNLIYHNNFIDNIEQVSIYPFGYANFWDNGYPSGGNFWSDYDGTDLYSGPYQNETGSDGIGDTSYVIDENNTDTYPFMGPFGPLTVQGENVTMFPTDDVGLIFENVTAEGSTTVNRTETGPEPPSGFKLVEEYYDIETTASYSGKIKVRIIYDDSDMTQAEEEALQLMQWNGTTQEWVDITSLVDTENNVIYGETSHLSMFGVTRRLIHDITTTKVTASKTIVGQGFTLSINATVVNPGDYPEIFNVTAYANTTIIQTKNVTLSSGNSTTITFTWNTSGFAKGNYTVSAYAHPVLEETYTTNNNFTDGTILVTIVGDVNGDRLVDMRDIAPMAARYGAEKGDPEYVCNYDLNDDGVIDMRDIAPAAAHYGETW